MVMQAATIDEVLTLQQGILDEAIAAQSPVGYFAALYQMFTNKAVEGMAQGVFEDQPRMERLVICFANHYFSALSAYRGGGALPTAWRYAFDACQSRLPIVFQHLALSLNPHIGYDLPAAVSQVCPGDRLAGIEQDFNRVNELLANSVDQVKQDLTDIWPPLKLTSRFARLEKAIVNFGFEEVRGMAWRSATELAPLDGTERAAKLRDIDFRLREFSTSLRFPGVATAVAVVIRLGERGNVADRIRDLQDAGARLPAAQTLIQG